MNRLRGMLVYLSGGMDRVSWDEATEWREWITPQLWGRGIGVFNPCNKPLSGATEDVYLHAKVKLWKSQGEWEKIRDAYKPIVGVDLRMVDLSSFVISYIDMDSHACGTYDEDFSAISDRKPVLFMIKQGKENTPNWMFGRIPHEHIFGSWDDLLEYVRHVDEDEIVDHMRRWTFFDYKKVWGNDR